MKQWDHQWHRWKPSIDISAAWQVVEKMRADGWIYEITEHLNDPAIQCAMFANRSGGDEQWSAANTAPLAICLAALKAVGDHQ